MSPAGIHGTRSTRNSCFLCHLKIVNPLFTFLWPLHVCVVYQLLSKMSKSSALFAAKLFSCFRISRTRLAREGPCQAQSELHTNFTVQAGLVVHPAHWPGILLHRHPHATAQVQPPAPLPAHVWILRSHRDSYQLPQHLPNLQFGALHPCHHSLECLHLLCHIEVFRLWLGHLGIPKHLQTRVFIPDS